MQNQNVNFFPWNDIPEEDVLPTGCYRMVVEEMEDGESSSGKRMPRARFGVKAPAEYVGMSHFENYVVGTDENPKGINSGTFGARNLKKFLSKAQIPPSNDIAMLCHNAKGVELMISINCYTEKDGEYAGSMRNRIVAYHRLGEREAAVAPGGGRPGGVVGGAMQAPAPPAMPAAVAAPQMPQPVAAPQVPQQPAPVAPPAYTPPQMPTPVAPPVVAPPAAAPAPVAPPVAAPAATPPPQAAPAGPSMTCTLCQGSGPAAGFGPHVQGHATGHIPTNRPTNW